MKILSLAMLLSLSVILPSYGSEQKLDVDQICRDEIGKIAILQGGRIKPLYVHAREVLHYLIGKRRLGQMSAVEVFCRKSLESFDHSEGETLTLMANVEHVEIRNFMGLENAHLPYPDLFIWRDQLQAQRQRMEIETPFTRALATQVNKIDLYRHMINGLNWNLPLITEDEQGKQIVRWLSLERFVDEVEVQKIDSVFLLQNDEKFGQVEPSTHQLEYVYARMKLPSIAMVFTLIGLFFLTIRPSMKAGMIFAIISLLIQTGYMTLRVIISGRAPITNMYETVIFSGYAALFLGIIISWYRREKILIFVGMIYSFLTLLMINFAHGMLSPSISPLVPVLRDNFWLSTHVTTIIIAYGAFALSWILANLVLFRMKWGQIERDEVDKISDLIYTCLKYGNILLFAGIILGGIWADYSWGRFWGWDPKETWSLIVFMLYMAILHGRYTSWITTERFIPYVALTFLSVMMAWFGVNYILATGLHSYGFSEGGAIFLGSFFTIQIIYSLITWPKITAQAATQLATESD